MEAKAYKIPFPFHKLSKLLIDIIVKDIDEGSTYKLASCANGITPRILYIWITQGMVDIETKQDTLCAYLVHSLHKVKQKEVKWCRNAIRKSQKGHKGAEWTLEHAFLRDFTSNAVIREMSKEISELQAEQGNTQYVKTLLEKAQQDF